MPAKPVNIEGGRTTGRALTLPPLSVCAAAVMLALLPASYCTAAGPGASNPAKTDPPDQAITFDSEFLDMADGKAAKHVDLNYFAHRGGMLPGDYQVQVKVNDRVVEDAKTITFRSWPDAPGKLYACLNKETLVGWGIVSASIHTAGKVDKTVAGPLNVKTGSKDSQSAPASAPTICPVGGIATLIPWAAEKFDYNQRVLNLTVPQAALGPPSLLRTAPSRWDEGIPALLLNYNFNGSQQIGGATEDGSGNSTYLGLNGQLNVLGWRVKSSLNWSQSSSNDSSWSAQDVYAQHDYSLLSGGQFSVGRLTSDGTMVDSVPFVGLKIESDSGMLDPALTTFSPAITGVANSPATVTVRQYGKVIYQQNLPQGPFSITNFNRSGNGDVEVEIRETDGSVRRFTMSSTMAPTLMTRGSLAYSASAGKYRDGGGYFASSFVQANAAYGLGANTTVLGSALVSPDYLALSAGGGLYSSLLGAFSLTATGASARMAALPSQHGTDAGLSAQLSWSRNIGEMSVGLSATRYSSHFHSFSDVQQMDPEEASTLQTQKANYTLSLSRSFGRFGSLSLSGNQTDYWDGEQGQRSYNLSYSTTIHDVGISVTAGYNTYSAAEEESPAQGLPLQNDKTISVNLSFPLSKWFGGSSLSGNYMYTHAGGSSNQQVGINGSLPDEKGSYSLSQGWGDPASQSASLNYTTRYANLNAGYSQMSGNQNLTYGMQGAVLIHPHGVTFSQQLSLDGANALVEMPGISGINVGGVKTDWRGYAVVSGLTPYDLDKVNVDMSQLPGNVELDASSKNTVPTRGAVVRVHFAAVKGYRVLFKLARPAGELPFGATVTLQSATPDNKPHTGIVGEKGEVYMSGLPDKGRLQVQWAQGPGGTCTVDYQLPAATDMQRLSQLTAPCQ